MQAKAVEIKFVHGGKGFDFSQNGLKLNIGDEVIVDTSMGPLVGFVSKTERDVEIDEMTQTLKNVLRFATEKDKKHAEELKDKAHSALKTIKSLVKDYNLEMKVTGVTIALDESKITATFTAENRVDFRELVKELGSRFKTRIELKQIGSRDEVKDIGGLGVCGKVCCCKEFLDDFEHVSIKMPKVQGLSLNPAKISGLCGRLMCCLAYENGHYAETFRLMPRVGSVVETPKGKGTVVYNNLLKRIVSVRIGERGEQGTEIVDYLLDELNIQNKDNGKIDGDASDRK